MTDSKQELEKQLNQLRQEYAAQLPARLEEVEEAWEKLRGHWSQENLDQLYRPLHKLAGSGTTFGFPRLSELTGRIERTLKNWKVAAESPDAAQFTRLRELLDRLPLVMHYEDDDAAVVQSGSPSPERERLLYLVEDDQELGQELALKLSHYGYRTELLTDLQQARQAFEKALPDVTIMDMILPEGDLAGAELMQDLRQRLQGRVPVIFQSRRGDFEARLAAVRSGADDYFVKPMNFERLLERLNSLTGKPQGIPYRVMVVEDDFHLMEHYVEVLQSAGMEVYGCADPIRVPDLLNDLNVELILMDLYMPGCNGDELAKILRQQERYLGIPIVFLSVESKSQAQIQAMRNGGDAFLTKPISDADLVDTVHTRVEQARAIRTHMTTDGLTGLLKHSNIKQQLEVELARSRRIGQPMALAMVDIDHFKQVNDQLGHLEGDHLLRGLAQLLKQRLRKSDLVGRYGGDEFMVLFPECTADDARELLEEIRQVARKAFIGAVNHPDLKSSISVGIADTRESKSSEILIQQADIALYQAKARGRDRCVCYSGEMQGEGHSGESSTPST